MPFPFLRAGCQLSIAAQVSVSDLPGTGWCESQMLPSTDFVPSRITHVKQGSVAGEDASLHFSSFFPLLFISPWDASAFSLIE